MAVFPFYHNSDTSYTIDDANYDCMKVIVGSCDWGHKYMSICELMATCDVNQLTRQCIIDALNDLTSVEWYDDVDSDKRFLMVTSDWCLKIASPCICDDWDRYVAASDEDNNPWTLDTKVKGSCSYDGLYCIDIERWWPSTLVRRPSGPNNIFTRAEDPDDVCENWECYTLKACRTWGEWAVSYECDITQEPQYLKAIYTWGISATNCKWRTVRYFAKHLNAAGPTDTWTEDDSESYFTGDWKIQATPEVFW